MSGKAKPQTHTAKEIAQKHHEAKNDCYYGVKMNNGLIYHLECFNKIQSN